MQSHQFETKDGGDYIAEYPSGASRRIASGASHDETTAGEPGETRFYFGGGSVLDRIENMDGGWSFDLSSLPAGLTYANITGNNTISGDLSSLPVGLTFLRVTGNNTISGDLSSLPVGLTFLRVDGNNTTSGDLSSLPVGLTYLRVDGNNTISGDLSSLPVGLTYLLVTGNNTISETGAAWSSSMRLVQIEGIAKTETFVDTILSTLARDALTWTLEKNASLAGLNAPPSASAQSDIDTLTSRGVTVITN